MWRSRGANRGCQGQSTTLPLMASGLRAAAPHDLALGENRLRFGVLLHVRKVKVASTHPLLATKRRRCADCSVTASRRPLSSAVSAGLHSRQPACRDDRAGGAQDLDLQPSGGTLEGRRCSRGRARTGDQPRRECHAAHGFIPDLSSQTRDRGPGITRERVKGRAGTSTYPPELSVLPGGRQCDRAPSLLSRRYHAQSIVSSRTLP